MIKPANGSNFYTYGLRAEGFKGHPDLIEVVKSRMAKACRMWEKSGIVKFKLTTDNTADFWINRAKLDQPSKVHGEWVFPNGQWLEEHREIRLNAEREFQTSWKHWFSGRLVLAPEVFAHEIARLFFGHFNLPNSTGVLSISPGVAAAPGKIEFDCLKWVWDGHGTAEQWHALVNARRGKLLFY
jgi:hypothetical protein